MKRVFRTIVALCFSALPLGTRRAMAEEGGSGHYIPGSISSFMDAVPPERTFIVRYNLLYYAGSAGVSRPIPVAGLATLGADAKSWANGLTLAWRPSIDLGPHWSYAISTTIPVITIDVTASVQQPVAVSRSDSTTGLGDIVVMPLMLAYIASPDFNVNFRVGVYTPTGSYQGGRLANTGKNFWTVEPTLAFMYFGTHNGLEVSAFAGMDFNSENTTTSYTSGTQLHFDGTLAEHVPLFGHVAGAGVSGFYYQQITADSGSGAKLGAFEAKDAGVGPVGSYITKVGKKDFLVEAKWLNELETERRLKGNVFWLKVILKF
jgi:hypothetical protein